MCGKYDCGSVSINNQALHGADCAVVSAENLSLKGFVASLNSIIECDCHMGGVHKNCDGYCKVKENDIGLGIIQDDIMWSSTFKSNRPCLIRARQPAALPDSLR